MMIVQSANNPIVTEYFGTKLSSDNLQSDGVSSSGGIIYSNAKINIFDSKKNNLIDLPKNKYLQLSNDNSSSLNNEEISKKLTDISKQLDEFSYQSLVDANKSMHAIYTSMQNEPLIDDVNLFNLILNLIETLSELLKVVNKISENEAKTMLIEMMVLTSGCKAMLEIAAAEFDESKRAASKNKWAAVSRASGDGVGGITQAFASGYAANQLHGKNKNSEAVFKEYDNKEKVVAEKINQQVNSDVDTTKRLLNLTSGSINNSIQDLYTAIHHPPYNPPPCPKLNTNFEQINYKTGFRELKKIQAEQKKIVDTLDNKNAELQRLNQELPILEHKLQQLQNQNAVANQNEIGELTVKIQQTQQARQTAQLEFDRLNAFSDKFKTSKDLLAEYDKVIQALEPRFKGNHQVIKNRIDDSQVIQSWRSQHSQRKNYAESYDVDDYRLKPDQLQVSHQNLNNQQQVNSLITVNHALQAFHEREYQHLTNNVNHLQSYTKHEDDLKELDLLKNKTQKSSEKSQFIRIRADMYNSAAHASSSILSASGNGGAIGLTYQAQMSEAQARQLQAFSQVVSQISSGLQQYYINQLSMMRDLEKEMMDQIMRQIGSMVELAKQVQGSRF